MHLIFWGDGYWRVRVYFEISGSDGVPFPPRVAPGTSCIGSLCDATPCTSRRPFFDRPGSTPQRHQAIHPQTPRVWEPGDPYHGGTPVRPMPEPVRIVRVVQFCGKDFSGVLYGKASHLSGQRVDRKGSFAVESTWPELAWKHQVFQVTTAQEALFVVHMHPYQCIIPNVQLHAEISRDILYI